MELVLSDSNVDFGILQYRDEVLESFDAELDVSVRKLSFKFSLTNWFSIG